MFIFLFRIVHRNSFLPFWIGRKNFSPAFHDRTSFLLHMTWKKSETMQSSLDSKLVIDTTQAAWMGAELSLLPPLKNMSCILIKLGYFYYLSPYVKTCFILVLPPSCRYSLRFLQLSKYSGNASQEAVVQCLSAQLSTHFHRCIPHTVFFFSNLCQDVAWQNVEKSVPLCWEG